MKIVCVTAITGGKSELVDPPFTEGIDEFICFTDQPDMKSDVWQIRSACTSYDLHRNSRYHKILIHDSVDCDCSIWVDGNLSLLGPLPPIVESLGDAEMGACKHWMRSWYVGALAVLDRDYPSLIHQQIERYDQLGFSRNIPFFAGGFLVRRHTERVRKFNCHWWHEVLNFSKRDQISIMFAAHLAGLSIKNLGDFYVQQIFEIRGHCWLRSFDDCDEVDA